VYHLKERLKLSCGNVYCGCGYWILSEIRYDADGKQISYFGAHLWTKYTHKLDKVGYKSSKIRYNL
jgi:hypothetical protein